MARQTIGYKSRDLILRAQEDPGTNAHSAEEQMREQLKDYEENVEVALKEGKKKFPGDFYIVVLTKKERLMKNVIRNYFFSRATCPTPEWDQAVYRYTVQTGTLQFLWVIPSKDTCIYLKDRALDLDKEERPLLNFVLAFEDGDLFQMAKTLNGEEEKSPLLLK